MLLFEKKIGRVRAVLQRPLTLAEKILYTHLYDDAQLKNYERGEDYVNFRPDRVAMQDATAQMALLQFINAGKDSAAVPSTVHCDHLIQAYIKERARILQRLRKPTVRYTIFTRCFFAFRYRVLETGSRNHSSGGTLKTMLFPGNDGGDGFSYPNAGGLGMVAIGVGGADAVDVMTGMEWELKMPKLIGVHLTGSLNGWASAKGCDSEIGRYSDRERWNECHYRIFWRRDSFTFGNR